MGSLCLGENVLGKERVPLRSDIRPHKLLPSPVMQKGWNMCVHYDTCVHHTACMRLPVYLLNQTYTCTHTSHTHTHTHARTIIGFTLTIPSSCAGVPPFAPRCRSQTSPQHRPTLRATSRSDQSIPHWRGVRERRKIMKHKTFLSTPPNTF